MNEETNGTEVAKLRAEVARVSADLEDARAQLNDSRRRVIAFEQARRLGEATPFDHRREILATTAAQLAKTLNEVSANGPHLAEAAATIRHELSCVANALAELRRQERAAS